mgnify:CR=1 FL=1
MDAVPFTPGSPSSLHILKQIYMRPAVKDTVSASARGQLAAGDARTQNTNIGQRATIRPGRSIPGPAGRKQSRGGKGSSDGLTNRSSRRGLI